MRKIPNINEYVSNNVFEGVRTLTPERSEHLRKKFEEKWNPKSIAEEICSIQPMPNDTFEKLYEASMSEEELIKNGYEPVDEQTKLMWRKKEEE